NTRYTLQLIVTGLYPVHLEVDVDGHQTIVYDDASTSRVTAGGCGIHSYSAGAMFANFTVKPRASATTASGEDVKWTHQVNTSVIGTTIFKSGGQSPVDDAGAVSDRSIATGDVTFYFT